jgi:hypothetical protein
VVLPQQCINDCICGGELSPKSLFNSRWPLLPDCDHRLASTLTTHDHPLSRKWRTNSTAALVHLATMRVEANGKRHNARARRRPSRPQASWSFIMILYGFMLTATRSRHVGPGPRSSYSVRVYSRSGGSIILCALIFVVNARSLLCNRPCGSTQCWRSSLPLEPVNKSTNA